METVTKPVNLLLEVDHAGDWKRWRTASAVSAGFHFIFVMVLLLLPESSVAPPPEPVVKRHVTQLFIPTEFTQKAPNKGKVEKELMAEAIAPRPALRAPAPKAATPKFVAPTQVVPLQPPPAPQPAPLQQVAVATPPAPPPLAAITITAPPPVDPPKLALEQVASPPPARARPAGASILLPNTTVEAAVRTLARNGLQSGQTVGDTGEDPSPGSGLNLPATAGRPRSNLELKSDPMGVDFRPYLLQVLSAVRRNWFAVYPEAARLGQRGKVTLEFAIARQGAVAKVVFSGESGAKALDQAAVAAVSASNPLPPLPLEFKGERVVLQMTFLYNMPR